MNQIKIRTKFIFMLSFCLVFSFKAFSQTKITGKIQDKSTELPLSNAIITINKLNTGLVLAFTTSNAKGNFEVISKSESDSITLVVRMLGFSEFRNNIPNVSQNTSILLNVSSVELKEIKIKPDPIKKYGDTLSYTVSAFKDKNDRVIADIIKKLPGVEVTPNGQILYQGQPINKYYIEGMDLLEGRYKLANENLNVEAVTNIEIIENHQPIKLLNGVVYSEKAALNIKLKKDITATGQISLGVGLSPLLWDVNFTPMIFTKQMQFLATYQANNVGKNNTSQLMRLTPGVYKGELGMESKQDWLGIQKLNNPPFKENRWLDNNSHIGSINVLKKLKNELELRLIADYSNDTQQQQGYTKTIFFNSKEDSIMLIENKLNRLFFNNLKTDMTLQKNATDKFLKNSFKIKAYWDSQIGIITNINGTISQQLSNPFYTISNDYKGLFKIDKHVLTLNSSVKFEKKPQRLTVSPGQFSELLNIGKVFEIVQQGILQRSFFTDNSVQFLKTFKAFSFDTQVGFLVEKQHLSSDISRLVGGEFNKIGNRFSNNLDWFNQKYYLNLQSRYRKERLNIRFSTPVNYYVFAIEDKNLNKAEQLNQPTFEPHLLLSYDLKNHWRATLESSKSNNFGSINQMYYGYVLNSYRDINRSDTPLLREIDFSNTLGLSYLNPVNSTFGNLTYSYSVRENNLLFINNIGQNGSLERTAIEQKNNNYAQSVSGRVSQSFRKIKTTVNISANFFSQKSEQNINTKLTTVVSRGFLPNLMVSSNPSKWFGLEYGYKLSSLKNVIDNVPRQSIIQQTHDLKLNINPNEKWYLGISNEVYVNNFNDTKNFFTDLIFRKTIGTKKIDLEANWVNIFNSNSLIIVSNSTFNYVETFYNLRPSQLLVKVRMPL